MRTFSREPPKYFQMLYDRLGLTFSNQVEEKVMQYSFPGRVGKAGGSKSYPGLIRNSLQNLDTWKKRLSVAEIDRIRASVQDISLKFYSDDEW